MLKITLLPAAHGDAIWVEYGDPAKPRRIWIDGGPASAYDTLHEHLKKKTKTNRRIELLAITHIDTDHIDGAILGLQDFKLEFGDVWFNGWKHLVSATDPETFGPEQGEFAAALLELDQKPWNLAFGGGPIQTPAAGPLPVKDLAGGARITLLSPGERQLRRLRRNWERVITDANWRPGDTQTALKRLAARKDYEPLTPVDVFGAKNFGSDNSIANGSSLAFVLDYGGRRCLLAGDAHPKVVEAGLAQYRAMNGLAAGAIPFDAIKLAHHGSAKSWSESLQKQLRGTHYLLSTSGARFKHPDESLVELILANETKPHLWFNYHSENTKRWEALAKTRGFTAHYPQAGEMGAVLEMKEIK